MIKVKLTANGLTMLNQKIGETERLVKEIQEEKEVAYWGTGDGWHDNSIYNQLIDKEFRASKELNDLLKRRDNAEIVKIDKRNIKSVQIGSIVSIQQTFLTNKLSRNFIWEIVGFLESDPKNLKIAYDTPLGAILLGKCKGEMAQITLPNGTAMIEILDLYENWEKIQK